MSYQKQWGLAKNGEPQSNETYSEFLDRKTQLGGEFGFDVGIDRVLPYRTAKGEDDEKHVHPLQLDVIERACVMWSNPGETVLTPFMGVGSEVYGSVRNGRKAIGVELKDGYYRQAILNCSEALKQHTEDETPLLALVEETPDITSMQ